MKQQKRTKYLSLDLGEKRIGIALSDELKIIAQAHTVISRTSRANDFNEIGKIVAAQAVEKIIVGLPLSLDGSEGSMARWARDYGTDLGHKLNIPVTFWDESFTSESAASALSQAGYSRKKMKPKIDAVAAAIILQSYLEAERESF